MLSRFLSFYLIPFSSIPASQLEYHIQFSRSVVSDSLRFHGLQHVRLPRPSPNPRACSNSCSLSQWCHPTVSSSVIPFSSWLQPFSASGFFPKSQFFTSGGRSIGASASAVVISPWDSLLAFVIAEHKTLLCCLNYSQMFLTGIRKINIDKMCEDQGDKNKITYILYLYYICLTNSVPWLSLPGIFNMNWIYKSISVSRCITILKHKRSHVRRLCIWARKSQMRVFLSVSWRSNLAMFKPLTESANYILASRFIQKHHRKTGSSCKHS